EATGGVWRLSVGGLGTSDSRVDITSWSMNITCLSNYQMADVVIDNEIGQCGSIFSWTHPYFLDNSNAGNISVSYTTLDADCKPTDGSLLGNGGQEVTEYFCVGTTTVTYTLADNDGNLELCSFNVTVLDAEDPILNLANCQNIVIQLGSTLCDRMVEFNTNLQTIGTDNCAVTDIVYSPASGTLFPIGITPVTLTIYDEAGNADSCVFTVEVLEFLPVDPQFACNQLINLSLDETCMSVITPDMILTGTEYRCLDNFCVTIVDSMGRPHDNLFTLDDLGDIFKVSVSDCIGGLNSCWGYVKIEEKLVPTIECPADLTIMCGANTKPDSTGYALLRSCEPMAEIYYEDRIQTFGVCNSIQSIITRNWFIDDKQGNIVTCAQRITVVPITLDSIVWPADIQVNQAFECSDVVANPSLIEPGNTGYPLVSGQKLLVGNSCMISIIKTDEVYPLCEGAYLIARTWKIANACVPFGPNNPRIHTQAIRVFDNTPPVIAPCPEDMTISTSAWYCFTESVELPIPENVYDVCGHVDLKAFVYGGGKIKMTGKLSEGTLKIYATDLTKGLHTILYRVTDGCGNVAECSYDITVIDETPPVATAKKNLVVSLTSSIGEGEANGGVAKVFAKDIDNGSYDNCSEVRLEIRRPEGSLSCGNDGEIVRGGAVYNNNITFNDLLDLDEYSDFDTDEGLFVKFCCDDVNDQEVDANGDGVIDEQDAGYHEVILRVWDDGNMNGIIGDEGDNYNDTWAYVKVEDKIVPKLYCEPVTEYCDEDIYYQRVPEWTIYNVDSSKIDPATVPSIESACNGYSLEYRDVANILTCHTGTITRTWRILDTRVSCDQIITILGRERTAVLDFPIALHSWAKCTLTEEEVIENAVLSTKAAQYGGNGDGGNLMKLDSNGRPVKFIGDYRNIGCEVFGRDIKINEYEVGDGCKKWLVVYDYINWCENDNAGTRTTIFKFEDKIPPLIIADAADTTAVDISCTAMFGIEAVGRDDNGCGVGYHWEITVSGINYLQTKKAEGAVLTGTEAKFTNLTPGTYSIHYKLTDGCGNFTELTTILIVEGKAPTPYCVSLSSAVMKNGVVELWARDFDKNSSDNCLDDVLYFTFNEMYPVLNKWDKTHYFKGNGIEASEIEYNAGQAQKWVPEIRNGKVAGGTSGQLFGCKVGDGSSFPTSKVKMTVWDRDLRHDFCEVTLTLIDNNGACGGASRVIIDGVVQVESGTALPNTEVA
ncbi:MAG TPA: HYR domain-containing protein, partial [Saprospiraceae bacterium]|nr:HYR domain-containing protein [Saprospiraceae bacterium]